MVFHESLNPERKFSLAIPLVFIAILGGTTAVLEVATVLSPQPSYAINPQAQLAQGAAPSESAFQSTAPKSCEEAIERAKGKYNDGEVENVDSGKAGTLDTCYGAVLKDY